jgi:GNAT superfamily N-acetyltransferase
MSTPFTLRPTQASDTAFLEAVYASTRMAELEVTPWTPEQKAGFCRQQFTAQAEHYRKHYPTAEYAVIEKDGAPAGRLYVDRWAREIRIMDIALLPEFRGAGLGTEILRTLQEEARSVGKVLSIHVEKFNPALRLYERLGFRAKENKGVYVLMEWQP